MTKYYAWAPITIPDVVKGRGAIVIIPEGDEVTKQQIGDADWNNLIAAGVIRRRKYPSGVRTGEAPITSELRQINERMKELTGREPFTDDLEDDGDEVVEDDTKD